MIINAENLILGRLASFAAKKALLGEKIDIVNCEKAVITGKRNEIVARYIEKRGLGQPTRGPFLQKRPDKFVRRTVRGMLPYKQEKGDKAFSRVRCHIGIPEELKNEKMETVKNANIEKVPNLDYITVGLLCRSIGGK